MQQQQQQLPGMSAFATPNNAMHVQHTDTNPSAPLNSPFASNAYPAPGIAMGGCGPMQQQQAQQRSFSMQQQQQRMQNMHDPSNGALFTMGPYESNVSNHPGLTNTNAGSFDTSMNTNQRTVRVETVPLDLSIVSNEADKRTITCIHKNMLDLTENVPFFHEKNVDDIGHAYRVTLKWEDTYWVYANKALNEKIQSIDGVQDVRIGNLQITIIVKKQSQGNTTSNNANDRNGDLPSLDVKDPVARLLYVPLTEQDVDFIRFITTTHPSMPCMQKGLLLDFMKNIQKEAQTSRKKRTKASKGVTKRRQ